MTSLHEISTALKAIARDEKIKSRILDNPGLYQLLLKAALRFIGGETLAQCIPVVHALNKRGFLTTIDFMGENTRSSELANQATEEFLKIIETIKTEKLPSSISLDLSHIGLAASDKLALSNATVISMAARDAGLEMMISMEGSEKTDQILSLYNRLSTKFDNVGITIQANLFRTDRDFQSILQQKGKIRLVKGAFLESEAAARPKGNLVDCAYQEFAEVLIRKGHRCSMATHDNALINRVLSFIEKNHLDFDPLEFEMLYSVNFETLERMKKLGFPVRVYVPYGKEWYLYFCHRLAEHPPNLYQALLDIL